MGQRRLVAMAMVVLSPGCSALEADSKREPVESVGKIGQSPTASAEPIEPLRAHSPENERLVKLGARLFHDPILSKDNTVACSSCHDLNAGGDDGKPQSIGIGGKKGAVNAPTVFNAALNVAQFWDGRAETLEDQVDGPVQHAAEMGSAWSDVEKKLSATPSYASAFREALGDGPSRRGVKLAIAAFERTLITIGSPFDRWLEGDADALTQRQREGYELFKGSGCVACHQGQNVGGNMYQRFGVFGDYFADRGDVTEADNGRFNVTGVEADRHVFRVPSLRNVALTAPYFHDGSAKTLRDAVNVMAKYQLGREISERQTDKLVAFLESLTGPKPKYLAQNEAGRAK